MHGEFLWFLPVVFLYCYVCAKLGRYNYMKDIEEEIRHRAARKKLYKKRILQATIIISALMYSIHYPIFIRLIKSVST